MSEAIFSLLIIIIITSIHARINSIQIVTRTDNILFNKKHVEDKWELSIYASSSSSSFIVIIY